MGEVGGEREERGGRWCGGPQIESDAAAAAGPLVPAAAACCSLLLWTGMRVVTQSTARPRSSLAGRERRERGRVAGCGVAAAAAAALALLQQGVQGAGQGLLVDRAPRCSCAAVARQRGWDGVAWPMGKQAVGVVAGGGA